MTGCKCQSYWTADDIETDKNSTRFQSASHSVWNQYFSGNRDCQIKFKLLEMITSGHTKWSGSVMGGEIERLGERVT